MDIVSIHQAFRGVEVIGDMVLKTGDNPLRKHRQLTEKEERIVAVANHFLSSEGDICSLLHFGRFSSEITKSQQTSSVIFFGTFSSYGIVQEQSLDYFFPGAISAINSKLSITKIYAELRATFPS